MTPGPAATWIAPADETDRGNLLGAAGVAVQQEGRKLTAIVEGAGGTGLEVLSIDETAAVPMQDIAVLRSC